MKGNETVYENVRLYECDSCGSKYFKDDFYESICEICGYQKQ